MGWGIRMKVDFLNLIVLGFYSLTLSFVHSILNLKIHRSLFPHNLMTDSDKQGLALALEKIILLDKEDSSHWPCHSSWWLEGFLELAKLKVRAGSPDCHICPHSDTKTVLKLKN